MEKTDENDSFMTIAYFSYFQVRSLLETRRVAWRIVASHSENIVLASTCYVQTNAA